MARQFVVGAAVLGFLGVALGAFGAHGLEPTLEANGRLDTFATASRYHMYHALALVAVAWFNTHTPSRLARWSGYLLLAGTLVFSGSLYVLAVADLSIMGAVAPIGGALLLAGWGCLGLAAWTHLGGTAEHQTRSNSS
jgi:uncharacterized membrane protein YgdD (TMEM256/DUF423 family)